MLLVAVHHRPVQAVGASQVTPAAVTAAAAPASTSPTLSQAAPAAGKLKCSGPSKGEAAVRKAGGPTHPLQVLGRFADVQAETAAERKAVVKK
jgi:hypothetical protein